MKKSTRVERKRRRRIVFFRLVLLLALVAFVVAYAFKSNFFAIEDINVEGNNILSNDIIVNASRIYLGENILKMKASDAEKEIELLPYIKEANIKQNLPNTINIIVKEREPVVQLKSMSSYILVDNEGFVLEIIDNKVDDLPSFSGFNITDIKPRDNILTNEIGAKLGDFFNDYEILNIVNKMVLIKYDIVEEINIDLKSGISVAFGTLDNVKYKLKVLDKILIDIEKKQIPCKMIIMNKGENPILVTDN